MGVFNVQYHLDSETPPGGTRPLAFSNAGTNSELIINGQLPLVRIAERNAYKTAYRLRAGGSASGLMQALEDTISRYRSGSTSGSCICSPRTIKSSRSCSKVSTPR